MWQILRTRPSGLKFRRQHPIEPFVVDFFCPEAGLIVEIDGAVHEAREDQDQRRDAFLRERGFKVIRVPAAEIRRDVNAVIEAILARAEAPLHHASHGPPPRAGEEC